MVQDMILSMQIIEKELSNNLPELDPQFILVGSIIEGTRINEATELDLTMQFKGLENQALTLLGKDAFSLFVPENHPLSRLSTNNILDCRKFHLYIMDNVSNVMVKEWEKNFSAIKRKTHFTRLDWTVLSW